MVINNVFEKLDRVFDWKHCECYDMLFEAEEVQAATDPATEKLISSLADKILAGKPQKALQSNVKTLFSLDFSTSCPKRELGQACPYCYVDMGRNKVVSFVRNLITKHGMSPEQVAKSIETGFYTTDSPEHKTGEKFEAPTQAKRVFKGVYNGEILRLRKGSIDKLNDAGGLRLFASGDYRGTEEEDKQLAQVFDDADKKGLMIKAVTKQPDFIKKWSDRTSVTNISIDNLKEKSKAPSWDEAKKLKEEFPKVKIRAVALNPEEVKMFHSQPWVDVVTLFHGSANELAKKDIEAVNMPVGSQIYDQLIGELEGGEGADKKFCCAKEKCWKCNVRCGLGSKDPSCSPTLQGAVK